MRESSQKRIIQALRMHKSENSLRRQIFDCFTAVRLILKKQSTKTREHFSSNKSAFIGKHESKDRQRPN